MTAQPFAYAWRWKGGATWKLTLTKKPNHHPDIEIKELFESRASQAAPAPSDALREAPCAGTLLEWMTYHKKPLQLWREADEGEGYCASEGSWVVVDNHKGTVMGSGPTAEDALREAYDDGLPTPTEGGAA